MLNFSSRKRIPFLSFFLSFFLSVSHSPPLSRYKLSYCFYFSPESRRSGTIALQEFFMQQTPRVVQTSLTRFCNWVLRCAAANVVTTCKIVKINNILENYSFSKMSGIFSQKFHISEAKFFGTLIS